MGSDAEVEFTGLMQECSSEIVYFLPYEKFIYRLGDAWALHQPATKDGLFWYLSHRGLSDEEARVLINGKIFTKAFGAAPKPGEKPIYAEYGKQYLNTYHPPEIKAQPGAYPTISRVIDHLTDHDPEGAVWLMNWIAAKIQDPLLVPKVAVVLCTPPGAGKGTLNAAIQAMLGTKNCSTIQGQDLEGRFNAEWVDKLFILADELSSNNIKDVSAKLKVLIDSAKVKYEAKGENQISIHNHMAWMFASNDRVAPVVIEKDDRRYTVFSNFEEVPADYTTLLQSCYQADLKTPTEAFSAEISAFLYDLQRTEVDRRQVSTPYKNYAREQLIKASLSGHEVFFAHIEAGGLDGILETITAKNFALSRTRADWDFGEDGVAVPALYQAYRELCQNAGGKPMRDTKFGVALAHHSVKGSTSSWTLTTNKSTDGRMVECYKVPRKTKQTPKKLVAVP